MSFFPLIFFPSLGIQEPTQGMSILLQTYMQKWQGFLLNQSKLSLWLSV